MAWVIVLKNNRCKCLLYDVTKKCFFFLDVQHMTLNAAYKLCTINYHYKYHNNKNESIPVLQPMSVCDRIPTHGHGKAGHGDLKTKGRGIKKERRNAGMGVCWGGGKSLSRGASRLLLEYINCVLILHFKLKEEFGVFTRRMIKFQSSCRTMLFELIFNEQRPLLSSIPIQLRPHLHEDACR